jgi:hypothetical protein
MIAPKPSKSGMAAGDSTGSVAALEIHMLRSRISMALLAGAFVGTVAVGSASSVQALPLPVSAAALSGDTFVDQVAHRNGSHADRLEGRGGHRPAGHHAGGSTGAKPPSASECDPHPNPDKINWCGFHYGL